MSSRGSFTRSLYIVASALQSAVKRLDKSFNPADTLYKFRQHTFTLWDSVYIFQILLATFWLYVMTVPFFFKLLLPLTYAIALLVPFTSQFFVPATPIFTYLLAFFSSKFIPNEWRPTVWVVTLPTLESALYGANVSDILTRFTHPILDFVAWVPYGVGHYVLPFVVAAFLWLFRPKESLHFWAKILGFMNLFGVLTQNIFPCASPWYEVIHGLTPAPYGIMGSPGGLHRIDDIFHGSGYTVAFGNSPLIYGAFPSLHSAVATLEALFLSHFFPQVTTYIWIYAGVLYWATMYLTHHYLIDVVGGACLAVASFYIFLPEDLRGSNATAPPGGSNRQSKYDLYDLQDPRRSNRGLSVPADYDLSTSEMSDLEDEADITYRSPVVNNAQFTEQQERPKKNHRHTASIASLIRAEERPEDGWSPIGTSFSFPPNANHPDRNMEEGKASRG